MSYFRIIVAFVFISFCPFLSGFAYTAMLHYYTGWDVAGIFAIQSIIWALLFAGWFDGSKYQKAL